MPVELIDRAMIHADANRAVLVSLLETQNDPETLRNLNARTNLQTVVVLLHVSVLIQIQEEVKRFV